MTPLQRFLWWLLGGTTYDRPEPKPQPRIVPRRPMQQDVARVLYCPQEDRD